MAQGKPFTPEQRKQAVESIKPHLELGYSRNEACRMVGLDPTTLSKWCKKDETLSMKLASWENAVTTVAIANIRDAVLKESEMSDDNKKETSKWWLERRAKKDFSTRMEQTGPDGESLIPTPIIKIER